MYDDTLHCRRRHFCCYCLRNFSISEILKSQVNGSFKIDGKKWLRCLKKMNMLDSRIIKIK